MINTEITELLIDSIITIMEEYEVPPEEYFDILCQLEDFIQKQKGKALIYMNKK